MVTSARDDLAQMCARGVDWGFRLGGGADAAAPRHAAVLVLFGVLDSVPADTRGGPMPADVDVLLQRRSASLGSHPGQISFPGGRLEAGEGPAVAALREAVEETGLDPAGVDILGTLADIPLPVSNHVVTPVPAWWTRPSAVAAVDHRETVDVFRVPVADLLDPRNRGSVELTARGPIPRSPAFTVPALPEGSVLWGFTAIVLSRMFEELGWAEPWDAGRIVSL